MSSREFAFEQYVLRVEARGVRLSESDREAAQADFNAGWDARGTEQTA